MSCQVLLCNWKDIPAAIQIISLTSTKERAHMQVSASDYCDRTILFTVSIFAKGQINDQCLLGNVESWESWNLADTWNPVSLNIKKLLPCLAIVQCIAGVAHQLMGHSCSYPVHISRQYRTDSTDAGVKQWPLWENHSLHSFHFPKGSGQWTVSPLQCWELKSLSLAVSNLLLGRLFGCWCCCVKASRNPFASRNHVACFGSIKSE